MAHESWDSATGLGRLSPTAETMDEDAYPANEPGPYTSGLCPLVSGRSSARFGCLKADVMDFEWDPKSL